MNARTPDPPRAAAPGPAVSRAGGGAGAAAAAKAPGRTAKAAPGPPAAPAVRPAPGGPPVIPITSVRPPVGPARMRRRHYGLLASFLLVVVIPFALTVFYLYAIARDLYASTVGFTIRAEDTTSASSLMGGLGALLGNPAPGNAQVLDAYIVSQDLVQNIDQRLDLVGHFSAGWPSDPLFSIWPDATIEDLVWFWKRITQVNFDASSGLMEIQVRARTPEMARDIAAAVIDESERIINALNEQARRDAMANAERDLAAALERLRAAREALTDFRVRTQIVDPLADIQGRMGVINNLQQQLAEALVEHDLLLTITTDSDPRVRQAMRRIEVITARIAEERRNFANEDVTTFNTEYPRLIAQFESLRVDLEFAELSYRAALTALDAARSNAARQSLYLATYIRPTLAQRAEYPERLLLSVLALGFLFMVWAVLALVYYSLRDRG